MYLARPRTGRIVRYILRESCREQDSLTFRDLYDLGVDPAAFITYPGGNSFCFDPDLVATLEADGISDADRELERVLFPFLKPHVQRIVRQMARLGRPRRRDLSLKAMAQAQGRLHPFDRRRLHYLRFGRMDTPSVVMRPQKYFNELIDKSRDELEWRFYDMEALLRKRERKQYVYHALDLGSHFQGDFARQFPQALDPTALDEAFLHEICRLNGDPGFRGQSGREFSTIHLCGYLRPYAIMWFDTDFGEGSGHAHPYDEFFRRRSMPPPPPRPETDLQCALELFTLTEAEWRSASRDELARCYRRLAMVSHPDQGGDAERFIRLKQAYERLIRDDS